MKYNYYNHNSLAQQTMKARLRLSLCLPFVLLLCSSSKVQGTQTKSPAPYIHFPNSKSPILSVPKSLCYLGLVAVSMVGWYMLFTFFSTVKWLDHFRADKRKALANNMVSGLHGLFIFFCALSYRKKAMDLLHWQMCLCISIGYFLIDLCLTYQIDTGYKMYFMLLHHLAVMLCISTAFFPEKVDQYLVSSSTSSHLLAQGLLAEITMPILYMCWYLIQIDQKESVPFALLSLVSLCAYAVFRVGNFTHIGHTLYQGRKQAIFPLILFVPIVLLNYYWFFGLCKKALAFLCPPPKTG